MQLANGKNCNNLNDEIIAIEISRERERILLVSWMCSYRQKK